MSGHTKGPWSFYTEPQPNGCPIVGSRGLMVCMLAHTVNQPEQKAEAIANARLIAAAPDLLAALTDVIGWIPMGEAWHTDAAEQAVKRAREVIARANGSGA